MKITVWTVTATIPGDNVACMPEVFGTRAAADARLEEILRGEWEVHAPEDEQGNDLPYPGNWQAAHERLDEVMRDFEERCGSCDDWGRYRLDSHELEIKI